MAVKKHELVADNSNQLDLTALAQYLQLMNEQPNYLPPPQELVKHCQDIVRCLAHTEGPVDQLSELLQPVENFILRIVSTANCNVRNEIFTTILDKFYSYISDPQFEACAATAVVLVILDESDEEAALSSARWMVQQSENEPAGAGLRAALSCLYSWLPDWHSSSALGFWIVTFIKALEENDEHDVLIETSLDNLPSMFSCFTKPQPIHQNTANVIFHILASLRDSVEAFDRISPVVGEVLVNLASDSGQYSRQLLQDLVDILTAMIDCIISTLEEDGQEMFRNKYTDVILCLERHMASNASKFIKYRIWRIRNIDDDNMVQKTGLLNLGNTCYINSVIQALFVARQFSTYAVTKAITIPYWEKIGELFAHMTHCKSLRLDPEVFCKYLRPTFFSLNRQHDSSEFLGYLLELLQSFEHSQETDFDYSIPPALVEENRFGIISSLISKNEKETEVDSSRRSPSPRPGSSGVSDSNGLKRSLPDNVASPASPPKKKSRSVEPSLPCNKSIIDELFAGVSLTRVTCGECGGSSLSRDMFRDLQLAFPEKPEASMHSVQSLLEYYCSDESLTGDNKYYCQACEKLCDAERSVLIEVKPKYLVLVLKNFKFDVKRQEQAKLLHSVHCNHQVTLHQTRAQSDQATYNLFAAIVHAGTTLNSGHYYTLLCDEDRWYQLNDSLVTYTDSNHVNKLAHASTPYILFYRRSDVEEPEPPPLEQLPSRIRDEIVANNKRYEAFVEKQRQTRQS